MVDITKGIKVAPSKKKFTGWGEGRLRIIIFLEEVEQKLKSVFHKAYNILPKYFEIFTIKIPLTLSAGLTHVFSLFFPSLHSLIASWKEAALSFSS